MQAMSVWSTAVNARPKTTLEPQTIKAYEEYVRNFEGDLRSAVSGKKPFLWIRDQNPDMRDRVLREEILIFKSAENVPLPKGILHVWGVSAFIRGAKAEDVISLLLDYDRHKDIYPSVMDSKLLEANGDTVRGYLRFKYKKVLTVVLNTEHQAVLSRLDRGRFFISVRSTRIAEVADPGKPHERELPPGKDSGFLWRLNTYWFVEPQKEGAVIECQSLTLTRSIPFGLNWLIRPFVTSIPRDSLQELVEGTRNALRKR
jgi:hypothetical protein